MKKVLSMVLVVALVASASIMGTMAYLTKDAGNEKNVFSVGNIDISLDEEVDVYGEGGEAKENENGADYTDIMPGDYLKKEVSVTNNGKTDAYVAVTVTLNNALEINNAIDEIYGDGDEGSQAMYDFIFDGWGINQNPRPGAYGIDDARGVIDGTYGLPDHVLHVDFAKTTNGSTVIGANNWFIAGGEKAGQYWVDGPAEYDGYYTSNMEDYEICYTYYIYLPAGETTTLFNGLNVPAEFDADQLAMFDGLVIDVEAKAIQADNMAVASQYAGDENGKAKTAFAILAGDIDVPEYSSKPYGDITAGFTSANSIWGEGKSNAKESYVVKIYSGDTYMGSTSLNNVDNIIDGSTKNVTWSIKLNGESTDYWTMNWEKFPTLELQPTNVELWIDGVKVDEDVIYLNNSGDLIKPATGAIIDGNGTIVRYVFADTSADTEEGETYVPFVSGTDELLDSVYDGAVIYLNDAEYDWNNDSTQNMTLTLIGGKGAIIKVRNESGEAYANPSDGTGVDYSFKGSTVTFTGLTIKTNEFIYPGFGHMKAATYNNCTIEGTYNLMSATHTFNDCTFNVSGDVYNVWTWGSNNSTFNRCTFNCDGKAILVYNQSCTVTFDTCTFNDNGDIPDKAAIETGADSANVEYNIYVINPTVKGFDITEQKTTTFGGTELGTNLWGNKNLLPAANLNVYIGEVEVY